MRIITAQLFNGTYWVLFCSKFYSELERNGCITVYTSIHISHLNFTQFIRIFYNCSDALTYQNGICLHSINLYTTNNYIIYCLKHWANWDWCYPELTIKAKWNHNSLEHYITHNEISIVIQHFMREKRPSDWVIFTLTSHINLAQLNWILS